MSRVYFFNACFLCFFRQTFYAIKRRYSLQRVDFVRTSGLAKKTLLASYHSLSPPIRFSSPLSLSADTVRCGSILVSSTLLLASYRSLSSPLVASYPRCGSFQHGVVRFQGGGAIFGAVWLDSSAVAAISGAVLFDSSVVAAISSCGLVSGAVVCKSSRRTTTQFRLDLEKAVSGSKVNTDLMPTVYAVGWLQGEH
ncbi:hypothetical protein V2J09_004330 [Rumex salicifolius]